MASASGLSCPATPLAVPRMSSQSHAVWNMTTGAMAPLSSSEILSSSQDPSSRILLPNQMMSSATLCGMYQRLAAASAVGPTFCSFADRSSSPEVSLSMVASYCAVLNPTIRLRSVDVAEPVYVLGFFSVVGVGDL